MIKKTFQIIILLITIFSMSDIIVISEYYNNANYELKEINQISIDIAVPTNLPITPKAKYLSVNPAVQYNNEYNIQNDVPILMYHAIEEKPWGLVQLFVRTS
jgi:hypothetical protein